jgi:hypothetical protein
VRGDPRIDLHGVVLVGRRQPTVPPSSTDQAAQSAETVEIAGLSLQVGAIGIVVEGPHPGVVNTLNWRRIGSLEIGAVISLSSGAPARSLDVELDDRSVRFLVPVTELDDDRLRDLIRFRDANLAPVVASPSVVAPPVVTPPVVTPPVVTPPVVTPPVVTPPVVTPPVPSAQEPARSPVKVRESASPATPPRTILLPPAPPSSKVAMPPAPSQADSSTNNVGGSRTSNGSSHSPAVDETLLRPIAVPSATRVVSPRSPDGEAALATLPEVAIATAPQIDTPPTSAMPGTEPDSLADVQPTRHVSRSRRRPALTAAVVVVVLAVAGAAIGIGLDHHGPSSASGGNRPGGVATKSSSGVSAPVFYGPAEGANPQTVASVLNIDLAELPSGWHSGSAPWRRVPTSAANSALAGCLGFPATEIGIVTGTDAASGPDVLGSSWATDSAHGSAGPAGFESVVVLTGSSSVASSDLDDLGTSKATSCLQGWFASLDETGDQIVGVPSISRFYPAVARGEVTAGFHISIVTGSSRSPRPVNEDLVVISAGRVEVALFGEALSGKVSASVEASLISGISNRLAAEAAT